ncbi:MAG: HPr(Ser) kinase/phosphatase [Ruminococcaceae bacterium]|nr:HPr(Ser) kinase/phosphatase [Oscillospiraceae bacterium]
MAEKYSVSLDRIIKEFQLESLYLPENRKVFVESSDISRPGLPLSGYFGYFDPLRIQILGKTEYGYLGDFSKEEQLEKLDVFFEHKPVAVVVTTNLEISNEMIELAKKHDVPLLRTDWRTSEFTANIISSLKVSLAPRITRHGVLVEVYGEGMLIIGDSGVGKSETAIELVKRGHRLIADDAVDIKKVSSKTLVGSAPEIIRYYAELRGIGVVDVRRIFGMGAVKETEKIDMIINLEHWVDGKMYDRFGLDAEYTDIMGIKVPTTTIPVNPGRNLAIILEIAAMNNHQKKMGYNTAEEFNKRLMDMGIPE